MIIKHLSPFPRRNHDLLDDPFFSSFQFAPSNRGFSNKFPLASLTESKDAINIKAEVAGLDEEDVKIEIKKNQLTISCEKNHSSSDEAKEEGVLHHIDEFFYGKSSRTFALPFDIDPAQTKASIDKGLLLISIKKPAEEPEKSHTVAIESNNHNSKAKEAKINGVDGKGQTQPSAEIPKESLKKA